MLRSMAKQIGVDVEATNPHALKKYKADYEKAQQFHKFALKYRDSCKISTLMEAKSELSINIDKLDADPFLINTTSGTYDLRYGLSNSHAHNPEDLITKCTAVAPSYKGMDIWLNLLKTIFVNDQELIDYVQLIAGLGAIGHVFLEAIIICIGSGSNDKSSLWDAIKRVMGTYAGTVSADVFTVNCRRNIKPELADLRGKDPFEFIPSHTTALLTNYLPEIPSGVHSKGTWRRLVVIPFNAEITSGKDVKNYADVLFEQAGEAILAWIIEGTHKIISKNYHLDTPQAVECATWQYKDDVREGEFLTAYKDYCTRTGEANKKPGVINEVLKAAGYERQKSRKGMIIKGLRLVLLQTELRAW